MSGFPVSTGPGARSGMMVTGPMDGKFFTHDGDYFRMVVNLDRPAFDQSFGPSAEPRIETVTFRWVRGLRGVTECDFWVPEGKDMSWALHHVLAAYADRGRE